MNLSAVMDLLQGMPAFPVLFKITVLLVLGWTAQAFLRHKHPEWRILMWRALAIGCLAIPLLDLLQPFILYEVKVPQRPISPIETPMEPAALLPDLPAQPVTLSGSYFPAPVQRTTIAQTLEDHPVVEASRSWPWTLTLPGLWLAVALFGFSRLAYSWHRLHTLQNQSQTAPDDLQTLLNRVAIDLGCKQPVRLRANPCINTPYLQGIFRPKIHLPSQYMEPQYREDLPGILAHELTHLQNRDLAWKLIFESLFCLLWFHPLVWKISAVHDFASEEICDRAASRYVGNPEQYTRTLARAVLDSRTLLPGCAALPFARSSTIHRRLRRLQTAITTPLSRKALLLCLMPLLLVIGGINGIVWTEGEEVSQYQPYDTMEGEERSLYKPYNAYVEAIPGYTYDYSLTFDEYKRTKVFDYGDFSLSEEVLDNFDAETRLWSQQDSQYGPLRSLKLPDFLTKGESEEMRGGFSVADTGFYVATASTIYPTEEIKNRSQALTITGQVMDEAGQPLSPAEIKAYVLIKNRKEIVAATQVENDGTFSLSLPKSGDYILVSTPPINYAENTTLATIESNSRFDFKHAPAPLHVQGTVIEQETHQPIAGAHVYLLPVHDPTGEGIHPNQSGAEGITDSNGMFNIPRIATGYFAIGADAKGHISLSPIDNDQTPNPYLRVLINDQTQSHPFIIQLAKGNAARIRVVDSEGNTVPQAVVKINVDGDLFGRYEQMTDENGECLFDTLAPGMAAALAKKETVGEMISEAFPTGPQENPPTVTITIPKPAVITGTVRDSDQQPVAQRRVTVFYSELAKRIPRWGSGGSGSSTQTDENGQYKFEGLGEGEYTISIKGVGENLKYFDAARKTVQTKAGETALVDFEMEKPIQSSDTVTIHGKVIDTNQNPIDGAMVNITVREGDNGSIKRILSGNDSTRANSEGEFEFTDIDKGDSLTFYVRWKGNSRTFQNIPFQTEPFTLMIEPAGTIHGVVVDSKTGMQIANAHAALSAMGQSQPQMAVTTATGDFYIHDVSPQQSCSLEITAPGYLPINLTNINVKSSETTHLKIEMIEGCTVKGKITKNGLPVRARIEISQEDQGKLVFRQDFLSKGEGAYATGLKPGKYTLKATTFIPERITSPLEAEFETTLTVQEGEKEKRVDVVLP